MEQVAPGNAPPLDLEDAVGDSPMFRQNCKRVEEEVEEVASRLKKLSRACRQALSSAQAFAADYRSVATEMMAFPTFASDSSSFEACMRKFGECLESLDQFQLQMASQMNIMLVGPIDQFLQKEVGRVKDSTKRCDSMKQKYSQALGRFSSTPSDSPKFLQLGEQLSVAKMEYVSSSLDNVIVLNEFEIKKRTDLLECMVAFMFTQTAYFHQGYELLKDFDPYLRKLGDDLDRLRAKSVEDRQTQLVKKNELTAKSAAVDVKAISSVSDETTAQLQGYLFSYEKSGRSKNWKRRYFILGKGRLNYYKDDKSIDEPSGFLDMIVSTVKTSVPGVKRDFLFEVISPSSSFMLQAENQAEKDRWVQVIQNAISNALSSDITPDPPKPKKTLATPGSPDSRRDGDTSTRIPQSRPRSSSFNTLGSPSQLATHVSEDKEALVLELSNIHPSNRNCVDCGRKNPSWASINLCAVLCIQCSGIHRSLGTHISKVRSITLDKWEFETRQLFKMMNNDKVNQVYEALVPPEVAERITEASTRAELEEFIKNKYVRKVYLEPTPSASNIHLDLQKAIRQGLLLGAYKSLARGADPNLGVSVSAPTTPGMDDTMSALHWSAKSKQLAIMELLLWNGAKPSEIDYQGRTGLHHATRAKFIAGVVLLLKHGSNVNIADTMGKTALDYAVDMQLADLATLLRLAALAEVERSPQSRAAFDEALSNYEQMEIQKEPEGSSWSAALPTSPRLIHSSSSSKLDGSSPEHVSPRLPSNSPRSPSVAVAVADTAPSSSPSPVPIKKQIPLTPVGRSSKPRSATLNDVTAGGAARPPYAQPATQAPASQSSGPAPAPAPVQASLQSFAPPAGWKIIRSASGATRPVRITIENPEEYSSASTPRSCYTCQIAVPVNEQLSALNRMYHINCVRCDACKQSLHPRDINLQTEQVLCSSCMEAGKRASIIFPAVMPALPQQPTSLPASFPQAEVDPRVISYQPRLTNRAVPRRNLLGGAVTPPVPLISTNAEARSASGPSSPITKNEQITSDIEDAILDELARMEMEEARSGK